LRQLQNHETHTHTHTGLQIIQIQILNYCIGCEIVTEEMTQ